MNKTSTCRLIYPQWQGGMNPLYVFGAQLLACIAPPSENDETIHVDVDTAFEGMHKAVDGVDGGDMLLRQSEQTKRILQEKQPNKLIVFGGDCSVTQAPFDYLSGRYAEKLGILWLDAHPDISGTAQSSHLHEMVLGNLLGQGPASAITKVDHPLASGRVLMAGLIEEDLREMDAACKALRLKTASPEELKESSRAVLDWIEEAEIQYIAVHWDLDVLSPEDFRSIYPAEPYLAPGAFSAAVGRLTLGDIGRMLNDISGKVEMVGLSITEHLPWDALRLRETLAGLTIFNS